MIRGFGLCMTVVAVYAGNNNVIIGKKCLTIGDGNRIDGNDNVQIGSQSTQIGNSNWIRGNNQIIVGNNIQKVEANTDPYFYRNSAYTPQIDKSFFDSFDPFNPPKAINSKRWFGSKQ